MQDESCLNIRSYFVRVCISGCSIALYYWFQFKQISQAYEVLSNSEKRQLYDQGGEQALKEGGLSGNGYSSPMDIFDMFFAGGPFGGGRGRGGRRERKGKDVVHQLSVSLEDLYKGATRKLALEKNVICEKCEGKFHSLLILFVINYQFYGIASCNSVSSKMCFTGFSDSIMVFLN